MRGISWLAASQSAAQEGPCTMEYGVLGSFTCRKAGTWNRFFHFPPEGRYAEDFSDAFRRLRPGLNPRTRVPEASMLTTRPPNSACYVVRLKHHQKDCVTEGDDSSDTWTCRSACAVEDGMDLYAHTLTMRVSHGISNNDSAIPSVMLTTTTTAIQHLSWSLVCSI